MTTAATTTGVREGRVSHDAGRVPQALTRHP